MRRFSVFAVLLILSAVSIVTTYAQEDASARIRLAHFSPDAPEVDIYINGILTEIQGLRFPEITDWLPLNAGENEIIVTPAGRPVEDAALAPLNIEAVSDGWYTIAVIGLLTRGTLEIVSLEEDFRPPADGNIRISMFHAISDIPPINVIANDITLVQTLGYPGFFGDNDGFTTADIPTGTYEILITPFDAPDAPLVDIGTYTLGTGNNYFIAAVGTSTNPQFVLISSDMDALQTPEDGATPTESAPQDLGTGSATIRAAHLSSGAPSVDVYLNDTASALQGVPFGSFTEWVEVPAGVYSIAIAPTATSAADAVVGPLEIPLATDGVYTLAVVGILDNNTLSLQVVAEDYSTVANGQTRLSVLHAAPSVGSLSLTANSQELLFGLPYIGTSLQVGEGFATRDILAGDYDLEVTLTDDPDVQIFELPGTRLEANSNTLIAIIDAEPPYIISTTPLSAVNDN